MKRDKSSLKEENQKLREEIEERKTKFLNNWQNAFLYPDWRKEIFQPGEVLLDADTAHCNLILSEDRRCVTWGENPQELPDNPQRFHSLPCVLGQQHFTSGRHYWEVEVDESRAWDLGLCRDKIMRQGRVVIKPEDGFWVIRFYKDEYWALTAPETKLTLRNRTTRVCIFLEYERGCISFYDMTDHSHIHTFSQCSFSGSLRPLFRLWSSDSGQLRICPVHINTN
ncbi:butyrophilin subfamily 1 member A1-like [Echinops telfairi]|uniref:Butyrophilin subfamily 1 member A1-like n=1 Tax=Echinops telfairi TaxID=9371 RepID=A0AC55DB52_ECHTE|nr:butyrophilin subfamily 1 member A1-like [Echinops telfairi]